MIGKDVDQGSGAQLAPVAPRQYLAACVGSAIVTVELNVGIREENGGDAHTGNVGSEYAGFMDGSLDPCVSRQAPAAC